ncbi:MAG TPA: hypothetical protein VNY84_00725 [Acidimicrobiales bacterium]|jgi:predicted lipoprotein with Yx(FWY)xxD motif|nr:hypothetical protein [Acidimicrobiales bacterium]
MRRHLTVVGLLVVVAATAACGSSASKTASSTPSTPATVSVRQNAKFGQVLVDASGMTLYRNDTEQGGVVKCTGGCATAWPPLTVTGTPTAGSGVGQLTTVTRPDGTTQVASANWPLYRFGADKAPGDTNGDGVAGIWHVATAGGTAAPATTPTTKSASGY